MLQINYMQMLTAFLKLLEVGEVCKYNIIESNRNLGGTGNIAMIFNVKQNFHLLV